MKHVVESYEVRCSVHGEWRRPASGRLEAEQAIEDHFESISEDAENIGSYHEVPCRCYITTVYTWEWD